MRRKIEEVVRMRVELKYSRILPFCWITKDPDGLTTRQWNITSSLSLQPETSGYFTSAVLMRCDFAWLGSHVIHRRQCCLISHDRALPQIDEGRTVQQLFSPYIEERRSAASGESSKRRGSPAAVQSSTLAAQFRVCLRKVSGHSAYLPQGVAVLTRDISLANMRHSEEVVKAVLKEYPIRLVDKAG